MIKKHALTVMSLVCLSIVFGSFAPRAAAADDDPPSRVARLGYVQGSVSFQPAGTDDWVTAGLNRPLTTGDKLWSDNGGRVELQLGGSLIRLSNNTGFSFLNLSDTVTQVQLTEGTLLVRVRRLDDSESYEIDTPNLAFSILRPGLYKISVNEAGDSTAVRIRTGEGEVTGGGAAYTVHANDFDTFNGTDQLNVNAGSYGNDTDPFYNWAADRDRRWDTSSSAQYVSADVVGYQDLDDQGSWRRTPDNGNVWFPRASVAGWAPYHNGHWDYIEPWGYTWVDDEPWGFAPFHYGRWVFYQGAWGWVPAPPQRQGVVYERPVYAPALVAWVGGPHFAIGIGIGGGGFASGVNVGWFPLGPREVYVPSYRVSPAYVNRVNVSNTTVTTTVVNNYYNTTVVNNNVNVTNVKYVNQGVPGAVAATTPQAFTSAQPVARNAVRVDQREVASAPVRAFTPAAVPAKQAVLGTGGPAARPPAALQTRAVVAKIAPPPPPPSFERRQEAIKGNGGKPLSAAQEQQIAPVAARREAPVRIAPAARAIAPPASPANRPGQPPAAQPPAAVPPNAGNRGSEPAARPATPNNPNPSAPGNRPAPINTAPPAAVPNTSRPPANSNVATPPTPNNRPAPPVNNAPAAPVPNTARPPVVPNSAQPSNRPPDRQVAPVPAPANRPTPPVAVHPNEAPSPPRTVVPPSGNPGMDRKQQQEQDQLHARQAQEAQRVQQRQEQDHAKAPAQQPAAKPQVEQQHQQQTQQLQQKQEDQQKQLQQKQQQERQNQERGKKPAPPPDPKP